MHILQMGNIAGTMYYYIRWWTQKVKINIEKIILFKAVYSIPYKIALFSTLWTAYTFLSMHVVHYLDSNQLLMLWNYINCLWSMLGFSGFAIFAGQILSIRS